MRKLFIFYNYKKHITCVGGDDGQTLGSGFIESTPVNRGPPRTRGVGGSPTDQQLALFAQGLLEGREGETPITREPPPQDKAVKREMEL